MPYIEQKQTHTQDPLYTLDNWWMREGKMNIHDYGTCHLQPWYFIQDSGIGTVINLSVQLSRFTSEFWQMTTFLGMHLLVKVMIRGGGGFTGKLYVPARAALQHTYPLKAFLFGTLIKRKDVGQFPLTQCLLLKYTNNTWGTSTESYLYRIKFRKWALSSSVPGFRHYPYIM